MLLFFSSHLFLSYLSHIPHFKYILWILYSILLCCCVKWCCLCVESAVVVAGKCQFGYILCILYLSFKSSLPFNCVVACYFVLFLCCFYCSFVSFYIAVNFYSALKNCTAPISILHPTFIPHATFIPQSICGKLCITLYYVIFKIYQWVPQLFFICGHLYISTLINLHHVNTISMSGGVCSDHR